MKNGAYCTFVMLNRPVVFQAVNIVAYVITLIVNGLAGSTTFLGGVTSADVSDMYPTLVTPAGFTFAIWGIIYTLLALFVIYQVLPKNKDKPFLGQISWFFGLSSLFNVVWLVFWHYDFVTYSVILMLGLLTSLIIIYRRLDIGRAMVDIKERLMIHLPFSVYLGWISIATIANVSVALTAIGWDEFGIEASTWAVLIIVVALLLSLLMIVLRKDVAFCCVVIWALFGILTKQADYENIVLVSWIVIGVLGVAIGVILVLSKFKR
ncbi:MAG TPA: tryptophan-rich sensory protein [Candidatus Bathyarchaeota archaeon]|nr:tryptophan-rich sensory protein [Candidatus Bathyarchaeota archaeon]